MKSYLMQNLSKTWTIELSALPNQTFSVTIDSATFDFRIQTFANDLTTISIYKDSEAVCQNAPITLLNVNLIFFSNHTSGGFYFESEDADLQTITYENLGSEVKLKYGTF